MWQEPANEIAPSSPWELTSSGTSNWLIYLHYFFFTLLLNGRCWFELLQSKGETEPTPSSSRQCPRQSTLTSELPNPQALIRIALLMKTRPSWMPDDAAVGRRLSFSWPEQSQEPKLLLSATSHSLVQAALPGPTADSAWIQQWVGSSGSELGNLGSWG